MNELVNFFHYHLHYHNEKYQLESGFKNASQAQTKKQQKR